MLFSLQEEEDTFFALKDTCRRRIHFLQEEDTFFALKDTCCFRSEAPRRRIHVDANQCDQEEDTCCLRSEAPTANHFAVHSATRSGPSQQQLARTSLICTDIQTYISLYTDMYRYIGSSSWLTSLICTDISTYISLYTDMYRYIGSSSWLTSPTCIRADLSKNTCHVSYEEEDTCMSCVT